MPLSVPEEGREEVVAIDDDQALEAAYRLTRTEGIIPALESAHAIAYAMKLAKEMDETLNQLLEK